MPTSDKYDILVELKALTKEFNKKMNRASKQIAKFGASTKTSISSIHEINGKMVKFNGVLDKNGKILSKTSSIIEDTRKRFKMYYLSMLFGGMMIKRITESIMRSTLTTFMKITEGLTPVSEGINRINVGFEYMKYSIGEAIGEALLPMIPTIVEFINKIADFVQQHPQVVFWSIAGALAFGTTVLAIGQWGLFLDGMTRFVEAGIIGRFITALKGIPALAGVLGFLGTMGKVLLAVAAGFLLAVLFIKMYKSNFMGLGTIINTIVKQILLAGGAVYMLGKILKDVLVDQFKWTLYSFLYSVNKIKVAFLSAIETIIRAYNKVAKLVGLKTISTAGIEHLKDIATNRERYYKSRMEEVRTGTWDKIKKDWQDFMTFRGNVERTYKEITPPPTTSVGKMLSTPVLPSSSSGVNITINAQGTDNKKLAKQISEEIDKSLKKYGSLGRYD